MYAKIKTFVLACIFCLCPLLVFSSEPEVPTPYMNGTNLLTGKQEFSAGSKIEIELYAAGSNPVGGTIIHLPPGDPRIGRVKLHKTFCSESQSWMTIARFFYYPSYTEIWDEQDQKTVYHYTQDKRLSSVERYKSEQGQPVLDRQELFFWSPDSKQLISRSLADGAGTVWFSCLFEYNERGQVIRETLFGNLSGQNTQPILLSEEGIPLSNGVESYGISYTYHPERPALLIRQQEDNGMQTVYSYDLKTEQCQSKYITDGASILTRYFYFYDAEGFLSRTIIDDGQGQTPEELQGVTNRQILEIVTCQKGAAIGQPLETISRYLDLATGQERLLERNTTDYSPKGQPLKQSFYDANNALRYSITMEYDDKGRLIKTTDSRGEVAEKEPTPFPSQNRYNRQGLLIASLDKWGNQTDYAYDSWGRLIQTMQPAVLDQEDKSYRPTISQEYDIADRIIQTRDANGLITTFRYNIRGNPIEVVYPDGSHEIFTYDLKGDLKESLSRQGKRLEFKRDTFGRPLAIKEFSPSQSLLKETIYTYKGSLLIEIQEGSLRTQIFYDGAGRETGKWIASDDGIQKMSWEYDATGQQTQIKQWFGSREEDYVIKIEERGTTQEILQTKLQTADGDIQNTEDRSPADQKEAFAFEQERPILNERGQFVLQKEFVNGYGIRTLLTYNVLGQVEKVETFNNFNVKIKEQQMRYDGNGNKTQEKHAVFFQENHLRSHVIRWTYDAANRVISITEGFGLSNQKQTTYNYTPQGYLIAVQKPDGTLLSYDYDEAGRLQTFAASDQSFHYRYQYDSRGRLLQVEDVVHKTLTKRSYDDFNRVISETLGNGLTLHFTYDLASRRSLVTLPDRSAIAYHYKGAILDSVERLSQEGRSLYSHHYDYQLQSDRPLRSHLIANLGSIDYQYDGKDRLVSITSPWWSAQIPEGGFDAAQNVQKVVTTDPAGTFEQQFEYTDDNQVASEKGPFNHHFQYDSLFNRLQSDGQNSTVNDLNQLTQSGSSTYQYDANGNCIEEMKGKQKTSYEYDALNRLTRVVTPRQQAVSYTYDSFHRRLSKVYQKWDSASNSWKDQETFYYVYDGYKDIGLTDSQLRMQELRVLGLGKGAEIGAAIALELNDRLYAPICDFQGSIRCLVDTQTKQVKEFYRYSAYGAEALFDGEEERLDPAQAVNPWRFSSKRYDPETGLIFFGKRYYNVEMGRWMTPDPLFTYDSPNLYTFVQNNPVTHYDLYGLFSISSIWNMIKSAVYTCFHFFKDSSQRIRQHLQMEFKLPLEIRDSMEKIGMKLLGEKMFLLLGYHFEETEIGVYGEGEKSDKVRVTFVNGILTSRKDLVENMELVSRSHGGINVHYIFRPTEGWTWDITKAALIKLGFSSFNFRCSHTHQLAHLWREMIEELGGLEGGGTIIHYTHSLGGTVTDRARELLTPEEQKMIQVISFGSATMIRNEGFRSVVNYVSVRDGVCMLDPIGRIRNWFDPHSNIKFRSSYWESIPIIGWVVDHPLYVPSYSDVLKDLGRQFLIDYCSAG